MSTKWLISINLQPDADPKDVTQLHGPFDSTKELRIKVGEIASDLGHPDDLAFAAFKITNDLPVLIFD